MDILKNKSIFAYISLILPVFAVVLAIVGGATHGLIADTFSGAIIAMLVIGAVVNIVGFLFDKFDIKALAPVFYGLALGLIFMDGIEVLTYATIGIDNNVGGQSALTVAYLVMGAVLIVLSVAGAFVGDRKSENR